MNQIELHPQLPQREMTSYNTAKGVVTQAWSPLARGQLLTHPAVQAIAARHGVTPAQAILRWHIENGVAVIPKSVDPVRIAQNLDLFGFSLDGDDHRVIASLETGVRTGVDPNDRN